MLREIRPFFTPADTFSRQNVKRNCYLSIFETPEIVFLLRFLIDSMYFHLNGYARGVYFIEVGKSGVVFPLLYIRCLIYPQNRGSKSSQGQAHIGPIGAIIAPPHLYVETKCLKTPLLPFSMLKINLPTSASPDDTNVKRIGHIQALTLTTLF